MTRCINLDWLEVFCQETTHMTADRFRELGIVVNERDYGTRIYHEMFTIVLDGIPTIEVRRNPKNPLLDAGACHIRLTNVTCYRPDAVQLLRSFLDTYGYSLLRISRVDICLDIDRFDDNTLPRVFMQRYMRGKFSKINQANIHSHGSDTWTGRVWNSVSWGSPSSQVSTKLYNKTLELYDPKTDSYNKPYIVYSWLQTGLIDNFHNVTMKGEKAEIWRIEFSIKSSVRNWFVIELNGKHKGYQSIHNTLDMYDTKEKLLTMFASLSNHYFHFKRYIPDTIKSKCPDRVLFRWQGIQELYKPVSAEQMTDRKAEPHLLKLLHQLKGLRELFLPHEMQKLIDELIRLLEIYVTKQSLKSPYSKEEYLALQQLLSRRIRGDLSGNYKTLLDDIRKTLNINDKTAIF